MTERIHLVVATPCFGGQVSSIYASSIFQLQRAAQAKANLKLKVEMRDGDALITRARANLMTLFLDDPSRDTLPVRGCRYRLYARAGVPADRIRRRRGGRRLSDQARQLGQGEAGDREQRPNVPSAALDYVLEINDPDHVAVVNGFTRVRYAGTGFLMIRRHVFEKMCAHPAYASLQFFREHSLDALAGSPNRFALFECMIDPETGTYLSEDFAFCKRWTDIGGEIWADLESRLDHVGPSVFHGDVSSQFAAPRACDRCGVRWNPARASRSRWPDQFAPIASACQAHQNGGRRHRSSSAVANADRQADRRHHRSRRGARSVADRAIARRQAGGSRDPARDTRVPSIVPFAMRGAEAAIARAGAGGCDRHGQQHADRISAGATPASN